jgi:hypothetical protein
LDIQRHRLLPLSNRKIATRHENQRPEGRGREGRRSPRRGMRKVEREKGEEEGRREKGEGRREKGEEKKGEEGKYVQSLKSKELLFRFRVGGNVIFPSTSGTPHCRKISIQNFRKLIF